jgi:hypothetical protein
MHYMYKVHKSYKHMVHRGDWVFVAVVVVVQGDSCVKREESATTELHRRGTV